MSGLLCPYIIFMCTYKVNIDDYPGKLIIVTYL